MIKVVVLPLAATNVTILDRHHEVIDGEFEVSDEVANFIHQYPESFVGWVVKEVESDLNSVEDGVGINVGMLRKRSRPKK